MEDVFIILATFFGIASLLSTPLAVVLGLPLAAWLARTWLQLKQSELELRRIETIVRLRESRLIPRWLDTADNESVLAWARAQRELDSLPT